jgi:hypothetical protein
MHNKALQECPIMDQDRENPFLLANPKRKGFVGRDLMLAFPLNIQLSGKNKESKILIE